MYKLTKEQINKAATWWADAISNPKFNGLSDKERKDPVNDSYQMAEEMAVMLVKEVSTEQRETFIKALKKELKRDYNPYWGLHVDYHPDPALSDSAEKAGISRNNFPWKTSMWFKEDGSVNVSPGYQQPAIEL